MGLLSIAFLGLLSCVPATTHQTDACKPIPGLDSLLIPGRIILLGEIHGTQEAPAAVLDMTCHALEKNLNVTIGLELPRSDQSTIDNFLHSNGSDADKQAILDLAFWAQEYQDGRASAAMLALIDSVCVLKAQQEMIDVVLIDDFSADDRDFSMAKKVIAEAETNPENFIAVLTGNFHNMIFAGSGQMGRYVLEKFGTERVVSLKQNFTAGSAWVDVAGEGFGPVGLRGDGNGTFGIFLDADLEAYHGAFEMDSIHYSAPAKDVFR